MYEYPHYHHFSHHPLHKKKKSVAKPIALVLLVMLLMFGSAYAGARFSLMQHESMMQANAPAEQIIEIFRPEVEWTPEVDFVPSEPEPTFVLPHQALALPDLFDGANPAVVAIAIEMTGRNAFGRTVTLPASGSGFIISPNGYIVTNDHVIGNATSITILMYNGQQYEAEVVGRAPFSDLAVIKINGQNLPHLRFGNSDLNRVGQQVAAIGNPLGEFANTMTVGYISAIERDINIDGIPHVMLQTDAAINRGNSGGPLINLRGEVIGVISAKFGGTGVEGLGFAIPSNYAQKITNEIIEFGFVRRAVLGITVDDDRRGNVKIAQISAGSSAANAGLLVGDIILSIDDDEVSSFTALRLILDRLSPGDTVVVRVRRGTQELSFTAILDQNTQ